MEMVVQHMQVLDQQITAMAFCGLGTDQGLHFGSCLVRSLSAFELRTGLAKLLAQGIQSDAGFRSGIGLHAMGHIRW
jgi:hypothetical protein